MCEIRISNMFKCSECNLKEFVAGSVIRKNPLHLDSVLLIPRHCEPKKFYRRRRSFIFMDRCICHT